MQRFDRSTVTAATSNRLLPWPNIMATPVTGHGSITHSGHWKNISYIDKVLRIYDASGQELKNYQLVWKDYPETKGAKLISTPRFSPVNSNLLLYRFVDLSNDDTIKFGAPDWTTGNYMLVFGDDYDSVSWEPDGSVVASIYSEIYRFAYLGGSFVDPVQIFRTPNTAKYLDVSADGAKYLLNMSGRIFWFLADGSGGTFTLQDPQPFSAAPVPRLVHRSVMGD
ncbi:MAG: hypothetical protein P8163_16435 [Candidatus Thiodiazotropha sp.]